MADGDTERVPLADTLEPFKVTLVAPDDVHCNVDDWPLSIEVGLAVNVAVGSETVPVDTVTVVRTVTSPLPLPLLLSLSA